MTSITANNRTSRSREIGLGGLAAASVESPVWVGSASAIAIRYPSDPPVAMLQLKCHLLPGTEYCMGLAWLEETG
ncbi:hypothetical protein GCM10022213_23660 [Parerythrobacter jejuensis]